MKILLLLCYIPILYGNFFKRYHAAYFPKNNSQNTLQQYVEKNITTIETENTNHENINEAEAETETENNIIEKQNNLLTIQEMRKRTLINMIVMGFSLLVCTVPHKIYDE